MTHVPETGARKKMESIYGADFRNVCHRYYKTHTERGRETERVGELEIELVRYEDG